MEEDDDDDDNDEYYFKIKAALCFMLPKIRNFLDKVVDGEVKNLKTLFRPEI
jgi:hypothetical protein